MLPVMTGRAIVLKVDTSGIGLASSRTAFLVSEFCTKSAIWSHGFCSWALWLFNYHVSQTLAMTEPLGDSVQKKEFHALTSSFIYFKI